MSLRKFIGALVSLAGLETIAMTLILSQGLSTPATAALVTGGFFTLLVGYTIWGWRG